MQREPHVDPKLYRKTSHDDTDASAESGRTGIQRDSLSGKEFSYLKESMRGSMESVVREGHNMRKMPHGMKKHY